MRQNSIAARSALASGLCGASAALAGLSQSAISSPGGYMQTGSYSTIVSPLTPGLDITIGNGTGQDFHELAYTGNSSVLQGSSYSGAGISNSAQGSANMGVVGITCANTSPDASGFAGGVADGGWKETFTINHPTLAGQSGFMVFQLRARGTMHVEGLTGSTYFDISPYKDNAELAANQYFDRGSSDPVQGGLQRVRWAVASYGTPDDRIVDGTVTMSVPFTFGQPFTLGVYALGVASQRSSGGNGGTSTGTLNFGGQGLIWNGIVAIQATGGPVSGHSIISGTGINWTPAIGGCYANCDGSTTAPILNVLDFSCFLNQFASGNTAANCDGSTTPPVLNVLDFSCFLNRFAAGCS